MDVKWTKEPWTVEESCCKGMGWDIPELPQASYRDTRFGLEADALRIVACVNACAGMSDPAGEIASLRESHARLVAVLSRLANTDFVGKRVSIQDGRTIRESLAFIPAPPSEG